MHPGAPRLRARAQRGGAGAVPVLPVLGAARDVLQGHLQARARTLHDRARRRHDGNRALLAPHVRLRPEPQPRGHREGHRRRHARKRALPQRGRRGGGLVLVVRHRFQLHGRMPGEGESRHQDVHRGLRRVRGRARRDLLGARAGRRTAYREQLQAHRRRGVLGKPAPRAVAHGRAVRRPERRGAVLRRPGGREEGEGRAVRRGRRRVLRRLPHLPDAVRQREAVLGAEGPAARRVEGGSRAGRARRELPGARERDPRGLVLHQRQRRGVQPRGARPPAEAPRAGVLAARADRACVRGGVRPR